MWTDLTNCTKSCGNGRKSSIRRCDNPAPVNSGNSCVGYNQTDNKACNSQRCPGKARIRLQYYGQ